MLEDPNCLHSVKRSQAKRERLSFELIDSKANWLPIFESAQQAARFIVNAPAFILQSHYYFVKRPLGSRLRVIPFAYVLPMIEAASDQKHEPWSVLETDEFGP
jgi:hypothetical protein